MAHNKQKNGFVAWSIQVESKFVAATMDSEDYIEVSCEWADNPVVICYLSHLYEEEHLQTKLKKPRHHRKNMSAMCKQKLNMLIEQSSLKANAVGSHSIFVLRIICSFYQCMNNYLHFVVFSAVCPTCLLCAFVMQKEISAADRSRFSEDECIDEHQS